MQGCVSTGDRPASSLVVSLDKAPKGIASTIEWLASSNRWQLDSKTEKVTSLSPSRGALTNK